MAEFPENFNIADGQWHLSMQWCIDGFYYTVLDLKEKKYIGIKKIELTGHRSEKAKILEEAFQGDKILASNYTSSSLMVQSYKAMLVPETLFDSGNLQAFLQFHHEIDDKDLLHFVPEKLAEAFIVFSVPSYLENIVKIKYPDVKFHHHAKPLINNILKFSDLNDKSTKINLHFGKDFFDVLITRNNKILLFNSFFYQKFSDVVYFVVNILNLYSLQPDNTKIVISGWANEKSDIETELRKIFKFVDFAKYNFDFKYADGFYSLPQHNFVNLLNLYNCEL